MKKNIFSLCSFLIILSFLLSSCNKQNLESKNTDTSVQSVESETSVSDDKAMSEEGLINKFHSMYEFDEENSAITVISEKYLKEYWQSNYEKEEIKSLTYDEILFIIEDSVNLYKKYKTIILPAFKAECENASLEFERRYPKSDNYVWGEGEAEIYERFPYLEGNNIWALDGKGIVFSSINITSKDAINRVLYTIYEIICYRIEALSSPKAFIQGAELIRSINEKPETYSGTLPERVFYCAGITKNEQRKEIINCITNQKDLNEISVFENVSLFSFVGDYFSKHFMCALENLNIQHCRVQPLNDYEELYFLPDIRNGVIDYLNETSPVHYKGKGEGAQGEWTIKLTLYPKNKEFSMNVSFDDESESGIYEMTEEALILKSADLIYKFYKKGNSYVFSKEESSKITSSGIKLKEKTEIFYDVQYIVA